MAAKHLIRSLPLIVAAFTVSLAGAHGSGENDSDHRECIDEGRTRTHIMGDRASAIYPFAVGPRSID